MPDMNGVEFLRALRQRPQHRDTPVVVATSERDDSPLMQEVTRMGVAAIVRKPWKPQELASVVAQACVGRGPHIDGI
jgi:two-component system chemotaxis response regulator CheY